MKRMTVVAAVATGVVVLLATALPASAVKLITGADIKDGSITRRDVRRGSLTLDRLSGATQRLILTRGARGGTGPRGATGARGARGSTGARGVTGPRGSAGPRGATGAAGPTGVAGVSGYVTVQARSVDTTGTTLTFPASCPAGKVVIGGGGQPVGGTNAMVTASYPSSSTTWTVTAQAAGGTAWSLNVTAICANATP